MALLMRPTFGRRSQIRSHKWLPNEVCNFHEPRQVKRESQKKEQERKTADGHEKNHE